MSSFNMPDLPDDAINNITHSLSNKVVLNDEDDYYYEENDNLSDISDNDIFEEDSHLIDYGDYDHDNDRHESNENNAKLLSLDEVPFDRDIRFVNVAVGARPRTLVQVNHDVSKRVINQVNILTSSNGKELRRLDDHYKKLDHLKKNYDKKYDEKKTPRQNEYPKRPVKEGGNYRPREKSNYSNKNGNNFKSDRPRRSNNYHDGARNHRTRDNSTNHGKPYQDVEISKDITTIDIMDTYSSSGLRPDAPEFVPSWVK